MAHYLITGCSTGIGEALAREAVRRGHTVLGAARRSERLEALARELGPAFTPLTLDVSDKAAVATALSAIEPLPDVVLLNAGVGTFDNAACFDLSVHEKSFATNYFGVLNVVDALFARMLERKRGVFVATSSLAAFRAMPNSAAYGASKAALSTAFESMRLTYGKWSGLKFLTIHPGFVETAMTAPNKTPMPFLWKPEKAARFILNGVEKGRLHINFPWPMCVAIALVRFLPPSWLYALVGRKKGPKPGRKI